MEATFKGTATSDFVVCQVRGKRGADCYLLDQIRAQMGFGATCQAIRDLKAKWLQVTTILIEDAANGAAIVETLQRELPGVIPVRPEGGKLARAQAVAPMQEAGNLWLTERAPWVGEFIEECATFPNGRNDDQVDAMTQAAMRLTRTFAAPVFEIQTTTCADILNADYGELLGIE